MTSQSPSEVAPVSRAELPPREHVRVTGPDAASFLQGMVSNDVEVLKVAESCDATLLTVKGSMVSDVRVVRLADAMVLDVPAGRGEPVLTFLAKYLISEEAELFAAPEFATVRLVGAASTQTAASLGALSVSQTPVGADVLVRADELERVSAALASLPVLSAAEYAVRRIEAGQPEWGAELSETTIPLEANLERAIHYKKGCYIGQEVIARATYRGQMNKKLMGLLLGETNAPAKAELRVGERKSGWLTTVGRSARLGQFVALGYVQRDFLTAGTSMDIAGGGQAVVAVLPLG